jgi:glycosyltransferase involved in cell wall biosynthesis
MLERPYVLVVATRSARKNLGVLEPAARALDERGIDLVTAGSGRAYLAPGSAAPGRALGYVPEQLMPGLYAGARALAMPSLYEGFGLPCLEAMACGTPVVCSDAGALPETCSGAALTADPLHAEEFAAAVLQAVGPEHERLRAAGLARAAHFTWERTAELTDRAIGELLGES